MGHPTDRRPTTRILTGLVLSIATVAALLALGAAPASAATSTGYGRSVLGTISVAGEKDTYTFSGASGDRLSIDDLSGSGSLVLKLSAPNGLVIWNNVSYTDRVETLPQTGTYTMVVSFGTYSYTGSYGFAINNVKNPQAFNRAYNAVVGPTTPTAFKAGPAVSINGTYRPLSGDFDGDKRADVFWYAPGSGAETMSFGTSTGALASATVPGISVGSTYQPVVGDFTGDGYADIFWYAPGSGAEQFWKGAANVRTAGFTKSAGRTVTGTYTPLAGDWNADGKVDIYWYGPGSANDFLWYSTGPSFTDGPAFKVSGTYLLTAGNFDGVAGTDVVFYAPSTGVVYFWWSRSGKIVESGLAQAKAPTGATPVAGDFNGDGRADILFYRAGSASDVLRRGNPSSGLVAGEAVSVSGTYKPVGGDFSGDKRADVLYYGAGSAADAMQLGITPEAKGAGQIEVPGAMDQYSFSGASGDRLSIERFEGSGSLVMKLVAPNGLVVWNNVSYADRFVDLTQTGTWKLIISYGTYSYTGDYTFAMYNVKTPQAFSAPYKTAVGQGAPGSGAGNIEHPGSMDQYSFSGTSGDRLSIQRVEGSGSLVMKLVAPNGLVVWNNVSYADRFVDLTQTGTWKLTISYGTYPYTGTYGFLLNNTKTPTPFTIAYGNTVGTGFPGSGAGVIELPGGSDQYSFNGSNGHSVTLDRLTGSGSLIVRLTAPNGTVVWNDLSYTDRTVTLNQTGVWKIKISYGTYPYTGDYSFTLLKN